MLLRQATHVTSTDAWSYQTQESWQHITHHSTSSRFPFDLWQFTLLLRYRYSVLWIEFCHTGPISLCIDLFVFICVYFVCFCFILHSCCITVSTVEWTWCDWSLILRTYLPSVLWHCWFGHLTCKNLSPIWPIMVWWDVKPCSIYLSLIFFLKLPLHAGSFPSKRFQRKSYRTARADCTFWQSISK